MTTHFQAAFTGSNGTNLTAYTPEVGSAGAASVGTFQITGNKAVLNATGGDDQNVFIFDEGEADGVIQCDITTGGTTDRIDCGLVFNWQDANNYWLLAITDNGGGGIAEWRVYERSGGSFTNRASWASSPANNTTYEVWVVTAGDIIDVWVDGTRRITYAAGSRPFKTETGFGLRVYGGAGGDIGAAFDNLTQTTDEPLAINEPEDLTWRQIGSDERMISAFDDAQFEDTFATDTSANYDQIVFSGTTTLTIGSGTAIFSGASTGQLAIQPIGETLLAPYCFCEAVVDSWSAVNDNLLFIGFRAGVDDFAWLYMDNGGVGLYSEVNGSAANSGGVTGSFSPPFTLRCVLAWPDLLAWVDDTLVAKITLNTSTDLRLLTEFSANWRPLIGVVREANGASTTFGSMKAGYVGGAPGVRDFKLITYSDLKPYKVGNKYFFTTTSASGNDFRSNHMVVMSVDTTDPDAPVAAVESHLFYNICSTDLDNPAGTKDKCTALYGGKIIRNVADTGWEFWINGWGYQIYTSDGIDLFYAETNANILTGAHAIDAYLITTDSTKSVYDNDVWWSAGTLKMAAIESNERLFGDSKYYMAFFEGTGPTDLERQNVDTGHEQVEQAAFTQIQGTKYVLGGGVSGPHVYNDDTTVHRNSIIGRLSFTANVDYPPSGFCIFPHNIGDNTRYYALAFTSDTELSAGATFGRLVVFQSPLVSGNEWEFNEGGARVPARRPTRFFRQFAMR